MTQVNPYLNFNGDCEQAFEFYRSVFGGEFVDFNRFSDMPPGAPSPELDPSKVMHVTLPLGDGQMLMGSDQPSTLGQVAFGNNVNLSVWPSSAEEGKRIFDALADEGRVTMPYERQFWNADYGSCVDRFGVSWMVNYQYPAE